jgi:hypothetical protein
MAIAVPIEYGESTILPGFSASPSPQKGHRLPRLVSPAYVVSETGVKGACMRYQPRIMADLG